MGTWTTAHRDVRLPWQEPQEYARLPPQVWVLTGDKVETAVNIAYSCGHFKKFMTVLSLTGLQDAEHAAARLQQCT